MPRKENTKAKTWERDRRNRMNSYFKNLSELLPPLLEGRKRNKIDILVHASKYIKELHSRTDELFCDKASDAHKEELTRLKKLVTQLISRTQLLSDLLKNAGISVPAEPALEKISPLKWSNRINVVPGCKVVEIVQTDKTVEKKKKKNTNVVKKKINENVTEQPPVQNERFPEKSSCTIENQENCVDKEAKKSSENVGKSSLANESLPSGSGEDSPSKPEIRDHKKVKRKRKVIIKKPVTKKSPDLNTLRSGTLVFSGGKLMPVVTPMQSLTPNIIVNTQPRPANPIILNNAQQGQMFVVQPLQTNHFQTISTVQTLNTVPNIQTNVLINPQDWAKNVKTVISSSKVGGMKTILPKTREVTETTMTYKVPIPAIHKEKLEIKSDWKDKSSPEKQTKSKVTSKIVSDSKSVTVEVHSTSKVSKGDNKDVNVAKRKLNVDKQVSKSVSSTTSASEPEAKKRKIESSEIVDKNLQVNKSVLDNNVTCESIENLKQVIEKIGEETPYTDVQLTDSTNCSTSTSSEQKSDNNLVNKSDSLLKNKKSEEKLAESSECQKSAGSDVSKNEKESVDKETSSSSSISQSKDNILEKTQNAVESTNKESSSVLTESTPAADSSKADASKENTISLSPSGCSIDESIILPSETVANQSCNMDTRLDNMLQSSNQSEINQEQALPESNKILLNLDTNTTMKLDGLDSKIDSVPTTSASTVTANEEESIKLKDNTKEDHSIMKAITYSPSNSFVPITKPDSLHSDLSNDIFASLQVPSSSNNSESISPTAAFLMAFPIVSSLGGKADVLDDDLKDDFKYSSQTPPMLLQIGAIEPNNFKINTRPLSNENLEAVEPSVISQPSPVKSSGDSTTPTSSTPATTSAKALPRVISSQTITDSFKIISAPTQQINKQMSNETNNSLPAQTNTTNLPITSNAASTSKNQSTMVVGNGVNKPVNNTPTYPVENKTQSNFNYTKDMPLSSISSSMATDILNKYIATTTLSTNTMASTSTSTKYNPVPNYVPQNCLSSMPVCSKENLDRSNQYNYSANDIPTEKDLCKLPLCPIEAFTERSNEYSARNKQHSFSNPPIQINNSEAVDKNSQPSMNQEKISKPPIQNSQNMTSNANYHPGKKVENKAPSSSTEQNVMYHKKESQVPNLNTYNVAPMENKINTTNKKIIPTSSQPSISGQKLISSSRSNSFSQQTNVYVSSTAYNDSNIARTTNTVATTSSNFSILSWTTFSSIGSSNNNNFPQYESTPAASEVPKTSCENFNYLPLPKDNVSLTNTMPQPSYFSVNTQAPSYEKSKPKENVSLPNSMPQPPYFSVDSQAPSYDKSKTKENVSMSNTMPQPPYFSVDSQAPSYDKSKTKENVSMSNTMPQPPYFSVNSQAPSYDKSKPKENVSMPNTMPQPPYFSVDSQAPSYDKSKPKENVSMSNTMPQPPYFSVDSQAPSYDKPKPKENVSLPNSMPQPSYFTVNTQAPSYEKSKPKENVSLPNTMPQPPYFTVQTQAPSYEKTKPKENASISNTMAQPPYFSVDTQAPSYDKSKSKENTSLPNTMLQPSYFPSDNQTPSYDKSKTKVPVDAQKRSYDMNKSRNMRVSQAVPMQKSPRSHVPPPISTSDYKYHAENKKQYKYPMDVDYSQNNYSTGLDLPPHLQHHQSQQNQQTHQPPNHQSSSKASTSQQIQPHKSDKPNYMLPDYDSHANFNADSNNLQSRYSNNHDSYSGANFKYNEKNNQQVHPKYQPTSQVPPTAMHHDNSMYSNTNKHMQHQPAPQSNQSKSKPDPNSQVQPVPQQQQQQQQQQMNNQQQHASRPPVNWMMTPEIKHNSNISDIILPPIGKELDFCQNNLFSQTPSYNQSGSNHQFYNNYDMSTHTFPNIPVLPGESKRNVDTTYYPEEQTFSWSPTKNLSQNTEQNQNLKGIETPTLPGLVGDLAMTSNISDKQNFLFGQMPGRSNANELNKDSMKDKETTSRHYQNEVNPQNAQQHSSHGMPFLSVSQLVDHEKAEKSQHQQPHNTANHHHHPHHPPPPQQQQQPPQPPPRKQRKGSNSPRASNKRQMDMRHKQSANSNNDQIHRQHEEPKATSSNSGFNDSSYQQQPQQQQQPPQQPQQQQQQQPQPPQQQQQQKYNQTNNEVQWRSRNCKSNYTAEALIGSNTNQADNSHNEKNLPKYSANYSSQNKFSGTLSSDPMPINYFPNVEDASSGYGQVMNQNFNPSYAYSSNANIYPSTNFITNISNSSTNYMMPLHENTEYLETNNFLLPPNVSTTSITTPLLTNMTDGSKSHHHQHYTSSKHQNCDKRLFYGQQKKSKRKSDNNQQNFDFPTLDDYHHASTPFLPNPLYQSQPSVSYPKPPLPPASSSSNANQAMTQQHHPSGTSLTNFNLSTIFPEINDKVTGYKPSTNNGITQPTSHTSTSYSQRSNYSDPMGQMPQASETTTHFNNATGSR